MRADVTRRSLLRRAMLLLGIGSQGLMACASRRPAGAGDPQAGRALGAPARTARLSAAVREAFLSGAWDATGLLRDRPEDVAAIAARLPYTRGFEA